MIIFMLQRYWPLRTESVKILLKERNILTSVLQMSSNIPTFIPSITTNTFTMTFAINTQYNAIEIVTKRETEKAELLAITYMHKDSDFAATVDVWSPKSAIIRSGKEISGLAPWMLNKVTDELYKRN